jgi:hypothetical protein
MTRRQLLGSLGVLTAALGLRPRTALAAEDRSLIIHWNAGGWDPTYVFDPRIGSDTVDGDDQSELAQVSGITFTDAETRPSVRTFFERYGDTAVIVNGLAVGSISHVSCTQLMMTGSRRSDAADLPTLVAASTGSNLALPHVVLSGPRFPGDLGEYMVPLSQTLVGTVDGSVPSGRTFDANAEARARDYLHQATTTLGAQGTGSALLYDQFGRGLVRRDSLDDAAGALTLGSDPTTLERLGAGMAALSMGLTRSLIVQGSLPQRLQWDSHQGNHIAQDGCFEHLFDELITLAELLAATDHPGGGSLLERTTVVVLSEMGRTPKLNGAMGKDHWPFTSALVFGAGVSGGQVVGASDEVLVAENTDLESGAASNSGEILTPAHLIAGLLGSFDVDPAQAFPDVTPLTAPFG